MCTVPCASAWTYSGKRGFAKNKEETLLLQISLKVNIFNFRMK